MAAALTLLVLLAGSLFIVRIASVILRLTGLPDHVARFQSVSALTGAGFTTTESESIVNFPIRRKVIVSLMILGNLGLVSVLSTFVIAFGESAGDIEAMIRQGLLIIAVVVFIVIMMTNKTLDNILCRAIGRSLGKFVIADQQHFRTELAMGETHCIADHVYRGQQNLGLHKIIPGEANIEVLSIRGKGQTHYKPFDPDILIGQNETLVCFGDMQSHRELALHLSESFPFQLSQDNSE